jgi:hypothetical protein
MAGASIARHHLGMRSRLPAAVDPAHTPDNPRPVVGQILALSALMEAGNLQLAERIRGLREEAPRTRAKSARTRPRTR